MEYPEQLSIGIVSLYGHYNYGNRLQSKAICSLLSKRNIQAIVIDCLPDFKTRSKQAIKKMLHIRRDPTSRMSSERLARFIEFDGDTQIAHVKMEDLNSDYCDAFLVGSDQIWNPSIIRPRLAFLEFAERRQRIAYAPSMAVETVPANLVDEYRNGLLGFERLSIREVEGAATISELINMQPEVLCDPVMALEPTEWLEYACDSLIPNNDYVFVYALGGTTKETEQVIDNLKKEYQAVVVRLSDKSYEGEIDAGPADFISLIKHARHVVTDSFHCAAMSILLGTNLSVFERVENARTFSRLSTLLDTFRLSECVIGGQAYADLNPANWIEPDYATIEAERNKLTKYLDNELARVFGESINSDNLR